MEHINSDKSREIGEHKQCISSLMHPPRFLDYHRRCHSPVSYPETCTYHLHYDSAPTDCCSATSFMHHLSTRGVTMLLLGFIAVAVPIIISVKQRKDLSIGIAGVGEDEPGMDCDGDDESPPPFESLGIHLIEVLGLRSLLGRFEGFLASVSDLFSELVLVSLVCCPIGFYYFGYALLSRVMPKVR